MNQLRREHIGKFIQEKGAVTVKEMDDQRVTKLLAELAPLPEEG